MAMAQTNLMTRLLGFECAAICRLPIPCTKLGTLIVHIINCSHRILPTTSSTSAFLRLPLFHHRIWAMYCFDSVHSGYIPNKYSAKRSQTLPFVSLSSYFSLYSSLFVYTCLLGIYTDAYFLSVYERVRTDFTLTCMTAGSIEIMHMKHT